MASSARCAPASVASVCVPRWIAVARSLWKSPVRCETSAWANAFAICADAAGDDERAVTATTSLLPISCAETAASSASRERLPPNWSATAFAVCADSTRAAALCAAARRPPPSRKTAMPVNVVSDADSGETMSCAVEAYVLGSRPE